MKQQTELQLTWEKGKHDIRHTDGTVSHKHGWLSSCGKFFVYETDGWEQIRYCVTFTPRLFPLFYTSGIKKAQDVLASLVKQECWNAELFAMDRDALSETDSELYRKDILACGSYLIGCEVWC